MMTEVYTPDELSSIKNKIKRYLWVESAIILLMFAVDITLCVIVDETNVSWIKLVIISLSVICGWSAMFILFNVILPSFARKKYVDGQLNLERRIVYGRVVETEKSNSMTIEKHVKVIELKVVDDDGTENILYWDTTKKIPRFGQNEFQFAVVQNRIAAYGDAL